MSYRAPYLPNCARMIFSFIAIVLFGIAGAVLIVSRISIPVQLLPTVRCVYGALKSSPVIKSVNVYTINHNFRYGSEIFRFGFEYAFKGKDGQPAISYVELVALHRYPDSAFLGDKIPREVSERTMIEGDEIEYGLHLSEKCHVREGFDNVFPQPAARNTWRRIDLENDAQ